MTETLQPRPLPGPLSAERVERVEAQLLKLPQTDCPLTHRFAPGICIREVLMPAGSLIIGHAHRFADMNIMLTGRMTLLNDDGSTRELKAPQTFLGKPGRKIAYIHEDVIWQNVWATDLKDVEAIEKQFLDKSPSWRADAAQRLQLTRLEREGDRADYAAFMAEMGFSAEEVARIVENPEDQVPLPEGDWNVMVTDSPIQGKGLFATADFAAGAVICPARIGLHRTPGGRYTNHGAQPNARMERAPNGGINLVAVRAIKGCAGGQPGEEITVDYRQALQIAKQLTKENL